MTTISIHWQDVARHVLRKTFSILTTKEKSMSSAPANKQHQQATVVVERGAIDEQRQVMDRVEALDRAVQESLLDVFEHGVARFKQILRVVANQTLASLGAAALSRQAEHVAELGDHFEAEREKIRQRQALTKSKALREEYGRQLALLDAQEAQAVAQLASGGVGAVAAHDRLLGCDTAGEGQQEKEA